METSGASARPEALARADRPRPHLSNFASSARLYKPPFRHTILSLRSRDRSNHERFFAAIERSRLAQAFSGATDGLFGVPVFAEQPELKNERVAAKPESGSTVRFAGFPGENRPVCQAGPGATRSLER